MFTKFHQNAEFIGIIIRNMHVKFEPIQRSYIFSQKNADSAGPRNIMKFQHFFKVHQIWSNLQNILESSSETCMWNLSLFREVDLFHRKMLTVPALEIWNFNIFSKFTKFHQTCRIYWNHHQKHACEIWAHSEKLTYFIEKCRQCRPFIISWNFNIFSKFTKFHQTCRTYWNHHQKHACEIWAHSEKLTYFIEKCWQCRPFEISWNFNIFSKFTKFHQTCRTYWNHHQKHACEIWAHSEKLLISQKNADSAGPRNIMKFQHFFKVHQISSNLQNIFESSSETCMWNLSQFRKVDLFHRKMPTVPALWNIMKFQHFFKVHQISSNLQNIFESSSETCMWNLRSWLIQRSWLIS